MLIALVGGTGAALASGTSAATGTVLVLPVGTSSEMTILTANSAAPLRQAGLGLATLDDAELAGFDAKRALACLERDGECEHLLRKAPAEWVLLLRVRHTEAAAGDDSADKNEEAKRDADADLTIIAKLYAANDGSLLQVEQRQCGRCNSSERMGKLVEELVAEVAKAELANQATETYINVTSTPANAILSIDGVVVGPTGQAYRVSPGEHRVSVTLDGYRSAAQTVQVTANEHKAITVGLGEEQLVGSSSGKGRRILTWTSMAVGTAALFAGVGWVVIDGDSTGDGNTLGTVRDTKTLGVSSMVAGSVLLGAGIVLLLTQDDGEKEMQVSAAPYHDGMAIGLSGHF